MTTSLIRKLTRYLTDNVYRFDVNTKLGLHDCLSDEEFLSKLCKLKLGYELCLDNPTKFNEKIQWLKIYDRKPEYTIMADKFLVKDFVKERIGEQYIIQTIGVWEHFDEIDFDELPSQFVLKCTHDSGSIIIVKDREEFAQIKEKVKTKIEKKLRKNYYYHTREWCYKNIHPRIIAEPYLQNDSEEEMVDYKFMCFNGKVRCSFVCSERFSEDGLKVTFFDREWNRMPFERHYPRSKRFLPKPQKYSEMITLAEELAKDIPFIRVDFYEINGKVYFGELTLYPGSGFEEFCPREWDETLGTWISLPRKGIL